MKEQTGSERPWAIQPEEGASPTFTRTPTSPESATGQNGNGYCKGTSRPRPPQGAANSVRALTFFPLRYGHRAIHPKARTGGAFAPLHNDGYVLTPRWLERLLDANLRTAVT